MDSEQKRFTCDLCPKTYGKQSELERHRRSTHFSVQLNVEKNFICEQCLVSTNSVSTANSHRASHIREARFTLVESGFRSHYVYQTILADNPSPPYIHPDDIGESEVAPRILELIEANLILHRQLLVYVKSEFFFIAN